MGPWGPLGEEGSSPLGLGAKGGAHSPPGRRDAPVGFSPTWGRGGGGTPSLAYIRRGSPLFRTHNHLLSLSLLLLPRADSPCLEFALGLEFITIGRPSLC